MPDRPAPTMRTSKCSAVSVMTISLLPDLMGSRWKLQLALSGCRDDTGCIEIIAGCATDQQKSPGSLRGLLRLRSADCPKSVPVMIRLERAFRLDADVLGLVLAQFG